MCNKGVIEGDCDDNQQPTYKFDINKQAYQLEFKSPGNSYYSANKDSLVPYSDETVSDMLDKLSLVRNESLFSSNKY